MAMGSKREKKSKELEHLSEKTNISDSEDDGMGNTDEDDDEAVPAKIAIALKRKHKNYESDVSAKVKRGKERDNLKPASEIKNESDDEDDDDQNSITEESENESEHYQMDANGSPDKKHLPWSNEDLYELINRMEAEIPERDALMYRTRVDKLNWAKVAFKCYSAKDCKQAWINLQNNVRRFRVLREVLIDARDWLNGPVVSKDIKPIKHPEMPRRPLSSSLLFYLKKKDKISRENPGLDAGDLAKLVGQIFKNLPPEKREKYERQAAVSKEEYPEKVKSFLENHPEYLSTQKLNINMNEQMVKSEVKQEVDKERAAKSKKDKIKNEKARGRPPKSPIERPPKKSQTPFGLFYASELKNVPQGMEKSLFKDQCKAQYKQMSDKKKVVWINLAEQDLQRYEDEVKAYKAKYPDFQVHKVRPILTKREMLSKERALGKPVKPPNSAYALYSRVMLQSDMVKTIHPKDRMNFIAGKWKNCTEEEQNVYREQVIRLMEQYKQEYQTYLDSLPEEERKALTQSKTKSQRVRPARPAKKREPAKRIKFKEPEQPPISACKYFVSMYKGEGDPVLVWKSLNINTKRKYEEELIKKKQAYIVEFEKFLKSLTKEELEAFSKARQQQVVSDDESSECLSETDDEADDANGTQPAQPRFSESE